MIKQYLTCGEKLKLPYFKNISRYCNQKSASDATDTTERFYVCFYLFVDFRDATAEQ